MKFEVNFYLFIMFFLIGWILLFEGLIFEVKGFLGIFLLVNFILMVYLLGLIGKYFIVYVLFLLFKYVICVFEGFLIDRLSFL